MTTWGLRWDVMPGYDPASMHPIHGLRVVARNDDHSNRNDDHSTCNDKANE